MITYFRKGADLLSPLLKTLSDAIIVVDDASCDGVAEFVKSSFPEVHFVSFIRIWAQVKPGTKRLRRVQISSLSNS